MRYMEQNIEIKPDGTKIVGGIEFPKRKVWVKTYGCQMNYHDTERVLSHLENLNFTPAENQDDADLVFFNTCAIRDLANQKFYSHVGGTKNLKKTRKNPNPKKEVKIAVGGCIAQTESKEILKKYKHVDFVFGTDVIDNVGEMVYRTYAENKQFAVTSWDRSADYSIETKITHGNPQAFVNIIKGCDKFCSYCIVPFTRGREKSRSLAEVVNDVARLVNHQGIQEITLLGQNVNSYGKDNGESLAQLLYALDLIEGLKVIRYTTSHPYDMSDELIEAHGKVTKLANHVHLPVQSGSNSVLQRMLREYTVEHYLGLIKKLRASNPNIVVSTDIIAGFPNETLSEHKDTLKLLKDAKFDFIYSYMYSPRKGTKASRMEDLITDDIRGERLREIQKYQLELQFAQREKMVGSKFRVLVDGSTIKGGVKKWKGRSSCMRIIHFESPDDDKDLLWNWVDVKVNKVTALSSYADLLEIHGKKLSSEQSAQNA